MFDTPLLLHKENLEQRQKWQTISFILIILVMIETILIGFLAVKVATKKESVRYIEFSDRGDFGFKVLPESNIDLSQRKLLVEQQLKQYVINRVSNVASKKLGNNEIDNSKVKFINAFSSRDVVKGYESELFRIYQEADFEKRDIHVFSFSEIENHKYRFDFKTIDTYPNHEIKEQRWVVYLKYQLLDPNDLKINQHKELNPLGVKITYYRGDIDQQQKIDINNAIND